MTVQRPSWPQLYFPHFHGAEPVPRPPGAAWAPLATMCWPWQPLPAAAPAPPPPYAALPAPLGPEPLHLCAPPGPGAGTVAEPRGRIAARGVPAERARLRLQLQEELCELGIRLKELELAALVGDGFDARQYKFLKSVEEKKIQSMKALQNLK
ncbi:uncharacterized protein C11orf91 homolog [Pithys albifrons albifrons]|uniref:uncharacterized protein C11orf91 homolog n=1 Tax=Pithys albifrons albifrons TaxID=3385563 RepID=UPI003A5CAF79